MTEFKFINLSFVLLFLFSASFVVHAQDGKAPDIRGRITKLNRSNAQQTTKVLGSILVERDTGAGGEYDKADVKITNETRIYNQADENKRTPLKIDALRLDQRVAVRFAPGPALLSYPTSSRRGGNHNFVRRVRFIEKLRQFIAECCADKSKVRNGERATRD